MDGSGGGGAVVRDHHGVHGRIMPFFSSVADPEHEELLACRRGIQLEIEVGARKTILETDNMGVKQALSMVALDRSQYGPPVEEIMELFASQDDFRVTWARHSANRARRIFYLEMAASISYVRLGFWFPGLYS